MTTTADHGPKIKELREAAQKLLGADYFNALGVSRTATPEEVKQAFIEIVRSWHPDRVPPGLDELKPLFTKVFARLELARATVSDPQRRARYIEELAKGPTATRGDIAAAEATLELRKAEAMLKKNDVAQAEKHYARAVELAPAKGEYQAMLVWVRARPDSTAERLRELVRELDKIVQLDASCEKAFFYRAQLKKRLDLQKEALADFARASQLNPGNVDAAREVRLHEMRKERAESQASGQPKKTANDEAQDGPIGFFKKLFKR